MAGADTPNKQSRWSVDAKLTRAANVFDVVSVDLNLVLDIVGLLDLGVADHGNFAVALLAKEVADGDVVVRIKDSSDGEVSVHVAHLVQETAGDTGDHVFDVSADGVHGRLLLGLGVPDLNSDLGAILLDSKGAGAEGALEGTAGAGDGDDTAVDLALNTLRDGDGLGDEFELHGAKIKGQRLD